MDILRTEARPYDGNDLMARIRELEAEGILARAERDKARADVARKDAALRGAEEQLAVAYEHCWYLWVAQHNDRNEVTRSAYGIHGSSWNGKNALAKVRAALTEVEK